jgi:hypothetical protein
MSINDELEINWKEPVVAYFKILSQDLKEGTRTSNNKISHLGQPVRGSRSETVTFRVRSKNVNHYVAKFGVTSDRRTQFQMQ